jgi:uncharacterized membrane protein YfcA
MIGVLVAVLLSSGIGLSLGLVGGGGSIITVPVLVYVAGVPVKEAVGLSLAIVGATAAVGAALQVRQGNAHLKAAAVFGATGMLGAPCGARLTPLVPGPVLMVLFALLMVAVGLRLIHGRSEAEGSPAGACSLSKCGLAGLAVGVLTGFLGVGGGFVIVPALLRFARLPMRRAAGTSLLVIAANAASGFAAHLGELQGGLGLAIALTGAALAGLAGGIALARRMQPAGLRVTFGGVALAVAVFLIVMNIGPAMGIMAYRG